MTPTSCSHLLSELTSYCAPSWSGHSALAPQSPGYSPDTPDLHALIIFTSGKCSSREPSLFFRETLPGDLTEIAISQQPPFPHTYIPPDRPHSPSLCACIIILFGNFLWLTYLFDYLFGDCLSVDAQFLWGKDFCLFFLLCTWHTVYAPSRICWMEKWMHKQMTAI